MNVVVDVVGSVLYIFVYFVQLVEFYFVVDFGFDVVDVVLGVVEQGVGYVCYFGQVFGVDYDQCDYVD